MVVHDDQPCLMWKLAVVEDLIVGKDGLMRAAHICMANHRTTRLIVKVENCVDNSSESTSTKPQDVTTSEPTSLTTNTTEATATKRVKRDATRRVERRIADWTNILRLLPEDVTKL